MEQIKNILLLVSLFIVTIYIPLTYTVYSHNWYMFNYNHLGSYEQLDYNTTVNATNNLIGFFKHENSFNSLWDWREVAHMTQVREIYDVLFVLFLMSFVYILFFYDKEKVMKFSKINIVVLILLVLVLPFFTSFWDKVFHPLLFNNDLWMLYPGETSYYLFPYDFFSNSMILIIVSTILENLFLIWINKKEN